MSVRQTRFAALALLFCVFANVHAATLFADDFDAYTDGSNLVGQGGWIGHGTVLVNDANHLSGTSLLGPTNSNVNEFTVFGHDVGGSLATGEVYTLDFAAYAKTSPLVTHNTGIGVGSLSNVVSYSLANSAYWTAIELSYNNFGWRFDARSLTGNSGAYFNVSGGYDTVTALQLVVDAVSNEIFGRYDFGSGFLDTTHFSLSTAQIQSLDAVIGFGDYRGANGGATTAWGKSFSPAEIDNLAFTSAGSPVPLPPVLGLMLAGWIGLRHIGSRQ